MMDEYGDLFERRATGTPEQDQGEPHALREPCKFCGCKDGFRKLKGHQDVVRCASCGKALYNAPKTETGRKARTVKTTHEAISSSMRARILDRAAGACEECHRSDVPLHVSHWISVKDGHALGFCDEDINSDDNLLATCEECNLGQGRRTLSPKLVLGAARVRRLGREK